MSMQKGSARAALLIAASVTALCVPGLAAAQDASSPARSDAGDTTQAGAEEEIVVTGIRASQARAIEIKREASSVVDAISAEDIGKLPDRTISDSLQRIPGVQIRREAGEGGAINIRGLPQVTTLLNGEEFLGANSVTTVQPNFSDIPSQLFAGATVFKSPTASLQQAGLSGTVDLLTRRPFDLDNGLTLVGAAEGQYGDRTEKWDPSFNGLVAYNSGRVGILVSAAYSDVELANSYRGIQNYGVALRNEGGSATNPGHFAAGNNGVNRGTPVLGADGAIIGFDVNGDGDANDAFITPQSHAAWVRNSNRERIGLNGSLQFEVSDALTLTADGFYTKQTQYDRTGGFLFQNVGWMESPYSPVASRDTGAVVGGFNVNTVQTYLYDMPNSDSYSETFRIRSESQNFNLQLDYDNGEGLKATVRGLHGKASRELDEGYVQFNLTTGTQWAYNGVGNYPDSMGGDRPFNPNGYPIYSQEATVDYSSGSLAFTFPQSFLDLASNPANYALKTISSEGNVYQDGDLSVLRGDVSWDTGRGIGIEAGARYSDRAVEQFTFERVSPFYAGNTDNPANPAGGCFVKWKAFDVNLNNPNCMVLDPDGNAYTAGLVRPGNDPIFDGRMLQVNLPVTGAPALWVFDPSGIDDSEALQNEFYPGSVNSVNPAQSYDIDLNQLSGYLQVNGEGDLWGMPFRANGGARIVHTKLRVRQNIVGVPQPYGVSGVDAGDLITEREFTDILPAFNAALDLSSSLRFRVAYAKTMTLLDFLQWGGGLDVGYAIDTSTNPPIFRAQSATQTGNPELDPWRADNVEASLELYTGPSSMLAAGVYYISVDSFIQNTTITRGDIPDNDGVVRNPALPVRTLTQGEGGTLKGVELSARQALEDYGVDGLLGGFGVDANYTLSLGDAGLTGLDGGDEPFQDNSKHQANVALWYEQGPLQARVAYNYRSKRLVQSNYGGITGLSVYQRPTNYFDASVAYDINDHFTVYGQASNFTGEYERYYLTWEDQHAWDNIYERRFIAGVRARF